MFINDERLCQFMAEVRPYLGLERISVVENAIESVDFTVAPMWDSVLWKLKFNRIENNHQSQDPVEQEMEFLETVEIYFNQFRTVEMKETPRGIVPVHQYSISVALDKKGKERQRVISRVPYKRKLKATDPVLDMTPVEPTKAPDMDQVLQGMFGEEPKTAPEIKSDGGIILASKMPNGF